MERSAAEEFFMLSKFNPPLTPGILRASFEFLWTSSFQCFLKIPRSWPQAISIFSPFFSFIPPNSVQTSKDFLNPLCKHLVDCSVWDLSLDFSKDTHSYCFQVQKPRCRWHSPKICSSQCSYQYEWKRKITEDVASLLPSDFFHFFSTIWPPQNWFRDTDSSYMNSSFHSGLVNFKSMVIFLKCELNFCQRMSLH